MTTGTTVVLERVGTAGASDVVDETLGFASDQQKGKGHVFALRFDGESRYACTLLRPIHRRKRVSPPSPVS